jgi:hypothetical protein
MAKKQLTDEERDTKNARQRETRKRRNEAMSDEERAADFAKRKAYKDGYYEKNSGRIKDKMRSDCRHDPQKFIGRSSARYEKHRDEINQNSRNQRAINHIEPTEGELASRAAKSKRLRAIRNERYAKCPILAERRRVAKREKVLNLTEAERLAKRLYQREYLNRKLKEDPIFKLRHTMAQSIRRAVFAQKASKKACTAELTGCDWNFLRAYLEARFTPEMSWENHGPVWHIDHVLPVSSFDLTKIAEQRKCCHYTNLQPMLAFDNMSKGAKVETQQELF